MPGKKKTEKIKKAEGETKGKLDEKEIIEMAKSGLTSEKIGEELRKKGIHVKEHNVKISKILKEKGLYVNPDLKNVEAKLQKIANHYEKNRQDKKAMREKDRVFSHLRKLKKHFGQN